MSVLGLLRVARPLDDLAAEPLDLVGGHLAEVVVERLARLELLAVDQKRVRARHRVAVLVEVPEEREAPVLERRRAVLVRLGEAGDVVVDELRDRGVLADDDEARRHADPGLLPELERLLVVAVERLERGLELRREAERVELARPCPRPFFGIFLPMCSQRLRNIGISSPGMLSATGTRGSLTMPHSIASMSEKSLIVHGKSVPFDVARAAQEERRRGQVDDARDAELAVDGLEAGDPDARGFLVLLGLLPLVALESRPRPRPASRGSSGAPRR